MKKITSNLTLIYSALFIAGCGALPLDGNYFADLDKHFEQKERGIFSPGEDFKLTNREREDAQEEQEYIESSEESRFVAARNNNSRSPGSISERQEIYMRENQLNRDDYDSYQKARRYLENDSDTLYYLSLSARDRVEYVNSKKSEVLDAMDPRRKLVTGRSVHASEIFYGMKKDDVIRAWGKPARVEIAGHPAYENERWSFYEGGQIKQVYFEGGIVHGWALDL